MKFTKSTFKQLILEQLGEGPDDLIRKLPSTTGPEAVKTTADKYQQAFGWKEGRQVDIAREMSDFYEQVALELERRLQGSEQEFGRVTQSDLREAVAQVIREHAKDYVWGVLEPSKVANQANSKSLCEETDFDEKGTASFPFRIFCDMDGVLVDLAGGILAEAKQNTEDPKQRAAVMKIVGSDIEWAAHKGNERLQAGLKWMHKLLANNHQFWATLPAEKGAMELWSFISKFDPFILSHPWDKDSASGKKEWLAGGSIDPSPAATKIVLTGEKHKYAINNATGAPNILIDDMEKYLNPWAAAHKAAGLGEGYAIKHVSADSTIRELKAIMERHENGKI